MPRQSGVFPFLPPPCVLAHPLTYTRYEMSSPQQSSLPFENQNLNFKQTKELPIYLTLKEVAALLKVKPRTIYAWVSDNRIPFERKGSLLRFRLDAVLAWNEPTR
jgi:excisionase family DNA binding protein